MKQRSIFFNCFLTFLFVAFFISCTETQTAVSCPGASSSGVQNKSGDSKKHHISRRQKKAKGEDGFVPKDKTTKRSARKAEKGKKKQQDETKVERKWHLLKKNREAKNDSDVKEKSNSKKNARKQKKELRKKEKHPQNGNPPKGQV